VVFAAQREIDVAISVNDDEAEPVFVNVGLNSKLAALVPAIGEKQADQSGDQPAGNQPVKPPAEVLNQARNSLGIARPEGEAASIFSGFYYDSDTAISPDKNGGNPIHYDAQIRSQFASGAAAVILADSPTAVKDIVEVKSFKFDHGAEWASPERIKFFDSLKDAVKNLPEGRQQQLYKNPPTSNATVDALIQQMLADRQATYPNARPCENSKDCREAVIEQRLDEVESVNDLLKWKSAIEATS